MNTEIIINNSHRGSWILFDFTVYTYVPYGGIIQIFTSDNSLYNYLFL